MSGSTHDQLRLVLALRDFDRAERCATWFPEVTDQQAKADQLYMALLHAALACGFEPGGFHLHMSALEFAKTRAVTTGFTLPNHTKSAGL